MHLLSIKNRPLTLVVGFNLLTLLVFLTAPIKEDIPNFFLFFIFALICQGLMGLGYQRGFNKYNNYDLHDPILYTLSTRALNYIFIFYTCTVIIKYSYLLKFGLFEIQGMIDFLMLGILDPHIGYQLSLDLSRSHTIPWSVYFFISIIDQVFFIIGFIKWGELGKVKKLVFSLFVIIEIFYWMGRGTNFGIISMITTVAFFVMVKIKTGKFSFGKSLVFISVIVLLFFGSISVFSYNLKKRSGNSEFNLRNFNIGVVDIDRSDKVFSKVSKPIQMVYLYSVSYLSQGYYHTCLAFDLDFTPTYLLGNNPALINLASVFHVDVWEKTYMYKLRTKGVDPYAYWHSAYLWYASDVSFFGVPFILFILGYFFGISWALCITRDDFFSTVMFIIFGNMLLYLFANNSYLSSVFYSFMFLLPVWYLTRVRRLIIRR